MNFFIGDIFGRRRMSWMAMGLILVGASLQTSAYQLAQLIVGRVITGFGTGIDSSTVPMYQSELSKKEWRGRLVSWEIWFIGETEPSTKHFNHGILTILTRPRHRECILDRLWFLWCSKCCIMAYADFNSTSIRCHCDICYLGLPREPTLARETWTLG